MSSLYLKYTQFFPPKPTLTSENLPHQTGKVFIVTGGSSGLGLELAKLLYSAGGTGYILTRDEAKSNKVITDTKSSVTTPTPGTLKFIFLDLADLSTIPTAVSSFLAAESRLDILFNNAGVASAPLDFKTVQGLEPHVGVNCVGPFLLTQLLHSILASTAQNPPRAAFASSGRPPSSSR